jgi:hypothetical protein
MGMGYDAAYRHTSTDGTAHAPTGCIAFSVPNTLMQMTLRTHTGRQGRDSGYGARGGDHVQWTITCRQRQALPHMEEWVRCPKFQPKGYLWGSLHADDLGLLSIFINALHMTVITLLK